ncbi:MAG: P-II family nitrogen regulator, partial [Clostridia bacterium]|nr:P-II family nitrogen regulator [Clostridia bacterium]
MNAFHRVLIILDRQLEQEYLSYLEHFKIKNTLSIPAKGTATESVIDYWGLENHEKVILETVVTDANLAPLFSGFVRMGINMPGTGIAMAMPVESIAGASSLKYLTEDQEQFTSEESRMKDNAYSLICIIAEKGRSDMVMDAARGAGAKGGTVVHAKGTGTENEAKFFGLTITPEKEMIYIATKKESKADIMRAIM